MEEIRVIVALFAEGRAEVVEYCLKPTGGRWAKRHLIGGLSVGEDSLPLWGFWWELVETCVSGNSIVVPVFGDRYCKGGQFPIVPRVVAAMTLNPMSVGFAARAFAHASMRSGELVLARDDELGLASLSVPIGAHISPPDRKIVKCERHRLGRGDSHLLYVEAKNLSGARRKLGLTAGSRMSVVCVGRDAFAQDSGSLTVRALGEQERLRHAQAVYIGAAANALFQHKPPRGGGKQARLPYFEGVLEAASELPLFDES